MNKHFALLFISTLSIMNVAKAGTIWIKNENIPQSISYKGKNYKVDAIKVAFINEVSKKGLLYTFQPMQIPLYESVTKVLPKDNYTKIRLSLQLKQLPEITHVCAIDKDKQNPINDTTILHLGLSYETNGLECTLAYYENTDI